ncbi:MAG TPA: response regulator transcription factor [Spirochaetia bacterium]|nr:response regulator transcription factor [Spirochaetia bacterium]
MRALIVEDEPGIADFVRRGLTEAGYAVDVAKTGPSGLDNALSYEYDVVVLDIMLPGMDGIEMLRKMRKKGIGVPVLLLTARDGIDSRISGLDSGADDYLVKPFAFGELLARLRAIMRRTREVRPDGAIRFFDLEMDLSRRLVTRAGNQVELSYREFQLLEYFLRNADQVLSRRQIADHVWGSDLYTDSNVVDVYVGYLRHKLEASDEGRIIHTVRGVGYTLRAEEPE